MLRPGRVVSYRRRLEPALLAASCAAVLGYGGLLAQTLDQPRELSGHHGPVMMGAFAPGGEIVATAGADHSIRVWDVATGQEIRAFEQHTGPVYCLAVSGDGRTLVSGSQDNTLRTWDLPQSKPLRELKAGETALKAFAIGPDGATSACIDEAGQVWLFDAPPATTPGAAEAPARLLGTHAAPGMSVAFRNDGAFLAAADATGRVSVWSPYLDGRQAEFLAHEAPVTAIRFRANDQRVVTAGGDGALRIWQMIPAPSKSVASGIAAVSDGAPIPGRPAAVVAGADGAVRIVDTESGAAPVEFPKQDSPVTSVAAAPNGSWLLLATESGGVRAFDTADAKPRLAIVGHVGPVRDVAIHPDGQRFATAGDDGAIRLWSLSAAWPTTVEAKGHTGPIRGFATAPAQGDWFATVADDLTTRLWNAGGAVRQVGTATAPLRALGPRFDGTAFATGDAGGEVRVWGVASGALEGHVTTTDGESVAVALSGDGQILLTVGANGAVRGWKLPLPVEKPKEGEAPPAPLWSQEASAGPPRRALGLPADRGFFLVGPDRKSLQRLKTDGASLGDLPGPGGPIVALALSRDAERIIAVDDAGAARTWNASGEVVADLALGKGVVGIAFSPDARELALADASDRVRVVDATATTGQPVLRETLLAPFAVAHVGFLGADASQLAVAGPGTDAAVLKRSLVRVWNLAPHAARRLAFSSDQQFVYASAADGVARQYRLSDGELVRTFEGGDESGSLALAADGQRVVMPGPDGKLHVRQTTDGAETLAIPLPSKAAEMALSPDNQRVAVASDDGFLRVFDLTTGALLQSFAGTTAPLKSVAFLPDNLTLVAATADGAVRVEKVASVRAISPHVGPVRGLALLNGGAQAATVGEDGRVVLTDLENRTELRAFDVEGARPTSVAARSDNQRLAAGTESGQVFVWNPNDATRLATLTIDAPVARLAWSPDNLKLAVVDAANRVHVFGPSLPGQAQQELVPHQRFDAKPATSEIAFGPTSRDVWTALEGGRLADWSYASPVPIRQFNHGGPVYGVAIGRDGKTIVSCSADQTVRVWDASTGQQRFQLSGHEGTVLAIGLGKDETFAVSSGADGTLRLWDVVGGRQLKQLAKFDATMYAVAIHPAGTLVAAAGADRKVHLLDVLAGTETATLAGHEDYVHGVAWRPDGARLLSYGYAGSLKLWNPPTPTPLVESRVGRIGNFAAWNDAGSLVLLSSGDGVARLVAVPQ